MRRSSKNEKAGKPALQIIDQATEVMINVARHQKEVFSNFVTAMTENNLFRQSDSRGFRNVDLSSHLST